MHYKQDRRHMLVELEYLWDDDLSFAQNDGFDTRLARKLLGTCRAIIVNFGHWEICGTKNGLPALYA